MQSMKKTIGLLMVAVLATAPLLATTVYADRERELRGREEQGRLTVTNGIITVIVTSEGKHPRFFWYANSENNTIYQIRYKGIVEYLDTGQEIFQRKFKADLEQFMRPQGDADFLQHRGTQARIAHGYHGFARMRLLAQIFFLADVQGHGFSVIFNV